MEEKCISIFFTVFFFFVFERKSRKKVEDKLLLQKKWKINLKSRISVVKRCCFFAVQKLFRVIEISAKTLRPLVKIGKVFSFLFLPEILIYSFFSLMFMYLAQTIFRIMHFCFSTYILKPMSLWFPHFKVSSEVACRCFWLVKKKTG